MIQIAFFGPQRKIIKFHIENKIVRYFDDNWKQGIQVMPMEDQKTKLEVKKMITSRRSSISAMGLLIADANIGRNKEQYDKCSNDEELAEIIRAESKSKGLVEIK